MLDLDSDFNPGPPDWRLGAIYAYGAAVVLIVIGAWLIL